MVGDVELDHMGIATLGFDLGAQRLQPLDPAPGERDARAGFREGPRELLAQTAGGAGDERDAAREIDVVAQRSAPLVCV